MKTNEKTESMAPAPIPREDLDPSKITVIEKAEPKETPQMPMQWIRETVALPYWLISLWQKDANWELNDQERDRLAVVFEPVFNTYIGPYLGENADLYLCFMAFATMTAGKARDVAAAKALREKAEKESNRQAAAAAAQ